MPNQSKTPITLKVMTNQGTLIRYQDGLIPAQRSFHASPAKFRLYSGAVRAGKTISACVEAMRLSRFYPNCRGAIFRNTFRQLQDTTQKTFQDLLDCSGFVAGVHYVQSGSNQCDFRWLHNNATIMFRHLNSVADLQSLDLAWFMVDEITETPGRNIWNMLSKRLSQAGGAWYGGKFYPYPLRGWACTNPDSKEHWVYKLWFEEMKYNPNYAVFHTTSFDNPWLAASLVRDLKEGEGSAWYKRYALGEWGTFEGMILAAFDEDKHVYRGETYPAMKTLFVGIDWGYTLSATAIILFGIDEEGVLWVLDEVYEHGLFTDDATGGASAESLTRDMISREMFRYEDYTHFTSCYADPANPEAIAKFNQLSLPTTRAMNDVLPGIAAVDKWFYPLDGPPRIQILPRCQNFLRELKGWRWAMDRRSGQAKEAPSNETPHHAMDAFRYGVFTHDCKPPKNLIYQAGGSHVRGRG